jgi:hypothetical protein
METKRVKRPPWLLYEESSDVSDILGPFGQPFSNVTDDAEDFFSSKNIEMLVNIINKEIRSMNLSKNGRVVDVINHDTVINSMRSVFGGTKLRNINSMNKTVVNSLLQRIKDELDLLDTNGKRDIWITNYLPESGIVRLNGIKLNRKKPHAVVFAYSNPVM